MCSYIYSIYYFLNNFCTFLPDSRSLDFSSVFFFVSKVYTFQFAIFSLILTCHQWEDIKEGLRSPPTSNEGTQAPPDPTVRSKLLQTGSPVWCYLIPSKESEQSLRSSEGTWLRWGEEGVPGPLRFQGGVSEKDQKGPLTTDIGNLSPTWPLMSNSRTHKQGPWILFLYFLVGSLKNQMKSFFCEMWLQVSRSEFSSSQVSSCGFWGRIEGISLGEGATAQPCPWWMPWEIPSSFHRCDISGHPSWEHEQSKVSFWGI